MFLFLLNCSPELVGEKSLLKGTPTVLDKRKGSMKHVAFTKG